MSQDTVKRKSIAPLTPDEVERLKNSNFYDASIYAGAMGMKTLAPVVRDFDEGIIDPDDARLLGRGALIRGRGRKLSLQIRGREIKRIALRGGRIPKNHLTLQSV
ncbi:hypothetical protein [Cerasicoccus arenae]|uniref:Uncharacterized protein n=1 Tax=Cerasicoccus arenae TaxID=424488 RepID=A0A8J3DEV6_9BACT|nr:hypothetical protein [Cerasicoccus arenae]MBK1860021.1 hypothetical protein [Cerasicoccus arenae]GHC12592.1 hypothetical protein GCM10007047_32450 [Cerasicoccus arenae]